MKLPRLEHSPTPGLMSRLSRRRPSATPGAGASGFATSTLQEAVWQRSRTASRRWGFWGAAAGALAALVAFAPASWLASWVGQAASERLLLTDAAGSLWAGSAVVVLTGGAGSRDASALPGRLHWQLAPTWGGLRLKARHACCLNGEQTMHLRVGLNDWRLELPAQTSAVGQWPASWLVGLGTPWNTLQLAGSLRLSSAGMTLQSVQGRMQLSGGIDLDLLGAGSRMSTLDPLGSYRLSLRGKPTSGEAATIVLTTLEGALRLSGEGQWGGAKLRFRGEARAAEGQETSLANLLNIIGRRQGAVSVISIG